MLNSRKTGLAIFDNFYIDYDLPKHKTPEVMDLTTPDGATPMMAARGGRFDFGPVGEWSGSMGLDGNEVSDMDAILKSNIKYKNQMLKARLRIMFSFILKHLPKRKPAPPKLTVQDFFNAVKAQLSDIETYQEKVTEFLKVAEHAKTMGQKALFEEIMRDITLVKNEAKLLAGGFKVCITEEQIVKFYKDSEKGLSLHFVRNYGRVIPLEACRVKAKADELQVFDNYCILYYDKDQKTFKETHEEREKRKDPILFGLVSGSRKLYYVADWIDEFCDLTLKQLIDKFGEEAISANDISVKYKAPILK